MADGLPIDGHMAYLSGFQPLPHPVAKTLLKLVGINQHEHPTKRVIGGDAMLQCEKASQPPFLILAIVRNVLPTLCASNHSTDGYHQDFRQIMFHFILASGIIYLGKGFDEVFEQGGSSNRDGMVTAR